MGAQKILVVDDEVQMRRVLRAALNAHGYEVVEAASGEEALCRLDAESCDFVVLDLNLPGLGGIETCRTIRAGSAVPIIVVSIRDSEKDKAAAEEAGADEYVTKPFAIEELLSVIETVGHGRAGLG